MDDRSGVAVGAARVGGAAIVLAGAMIGLVAWSQSMPTAGPASAPARAQIQKDFAGLPLAFEPNRGQAGPGIDFLARTTAGSLLLGPSGATLPLSGGHGSQATLRIKLPGAAPAEPRALERLPGKVNYLRGDDPSRWRTDVPTFSRVRYPEVWPGVDLDWYGDGRRLEYDFRLAPGVDPSAIGMRIGGAEDLRVTANGDLLMAAGGGAIRQRAPVAYQLVGGRRESVSASFSVDRNRVGFVLGSYDHSRPLVIDPVVLSYSTYLGGNAGDFGIGIAVDSAGAAYVTGDTDSTDFNTVGEIEGDSDQRDIFVSKLTPDGNALAYSTYLGGSFNDSAAGIAVDSTGAAYVVGDTLSFDYCVAPDCSIEDNPPFVDVFISKLTPDGDALAYSTYLGGNADDFAGGIAVDSAGAAYVTGATDSTDFNTTGAPGVGHIEGDSGAFDAFISKLTPAGTALAYSTYLGGATTDIARGIAVDSTGAAYVTGQTLSADFDTAGPIEGDSGDFDAFVSKLAPTGNALAYSTYLGGGGGDNGVGIAVDSAGAAYVAGDTGSTDFDTVGQIEGDSGGRDAFVSKLTPLGNALAYSTYVGGNDAESLAGIAVDSAGAAYVTGATASTDFDTVGQFEGDSADTDAFVSKLSPAGSALAYSTYLGGNDAELGSLGGIAVDSAGAAYVTGDTESTDFDTAGQIEGDSAGADAFVSKLVEVAGRPAEPPPAEPPPAEQPPTTPPSPSGRCAAKAVTIPGTEGKDRLVGTKGADVIAGLGGKDKIRGLGKGDRICGGKGKDRANGGGGKDRLLGQGGSDRLAGAGGNDLLKGAKGNDRLNGGPGKRDRCAGGAGRRDRAAGTCEREAGVP